MFRRWSKGCGKLGWQGLGNWRRPILIGLLAGIVCTDPAAAQLSIEPDWARRPDEAALSQAYPKLALALAVEGRVLLSCDVTVTGSLTSCSTLEVSPSGFGISEAALRLSLDFQMRPGTAAARGAPYGTVRIPINFSLPPLPESPTQQPVVLSAAASSLVARLVARADPAQGFLAYYESEAAKLVGMDPPGSATGSGEQAGRALLSAARATAPILRQRFGEILAAELGEADLARFAAFVESPPGEHWFRSDVALGEMRKLADAKRQKFVRAAARRRLCVDRDCTSAPEFSSKLRSGADPAAGESTDPGAPRPDAPWGQRPSARQTILSWPVAFLFGIDGFVRTVCTVGRQGAAEDCEVAYESPKNLGAARAAMGLTERYRLRPEALAALVGKQISINTYFPAPPSSSPPAEATDPLEEIKESHLALARRVVALQAQQAEKPGQPEGPGWPKLLPPLEPGLQGVAEAALIAAAAETRPAFLEERARILTHFFDEDELRSIAQFEDTVGLALSRAMRSSAEIDKNFSMILADRVAVTARDAYCQNRKCTVQPTPVSPAPSTRKP